MRCTLLHDYLLCRYQQVAMAAYDVVCQQQQQQQQTSLSGQPDAQQQQSRPAIHPALAGAAAGPWPANIISSSSSSTSTSSSNQQQQEGSHPAAAAVVPAAGAGGMMQVLEGTAQEVFRVLLFLVFTLEVFLISLLPFVGE
jgi:hypothetical protein